jgi:hypothetical protein
MVCAVGQHPGAEDQATDKDELLHGVAPADWTVADVSEAPSVCGFERRVNIAR